jgi:thioredoxin reductase (NADPH)
MPTRPSSEPDVPPETPDNAGAYPRLVESQIMFLSRYGTTKSVDRGETLYRAGERDCDFFVVLSGSVAMLQEGEQDQRLVAVHGPGRFLGDMSLVTGQSAYLTALVQEPGEVLAVPAERLPEAATEDPGLGELILRAFLVRRSLHVGLGAGFRIVGSRFSADTRRLRDFASRNRLPHSWVDLEDDREAEVLLQRFHLTPEQTPIVIWMGQHILRNPSNEELASLLGLRPAEPVTDACDLVVVGAGPAGLAAGVYGASEGLTTVVLDGVATGGQAATSSRIENYLGFPAGISGGELADRAVVQARKFGATFMVPAEARALFRRQDHHVVRLADGGEVTAGAVVIATGAHYRRLDVPGMDRLEQSSVYYAATEMEASVCHGDPVTVVGGGNSAGQAAVFLSKHASEVNLVVLHEDLNRDMSRYLVDRVRHSPRIQIRTKSAVSELVGDSVLEAVVVTDLDTGETTRVPSVALFVLIGSVPHTQWLDGQLPLDKDGFLLTGRRATVHDADGSQELRDDDQRSVFETGRPGVFAVGDVRSGSVKRVASAVGEGAIAVRLVHEHMDKLGRT